MHHSKVVIDGISVLSGCPSDLDGVETLVGFFHLFKALAHLLKLNRLNLCAAFQFIVSLWLFLGELGRLLHVFKLDCLLNLFIPIDRRKLADKELSATFGFAFSLVSFLDIIGMSFTFERFFAEGSPLIPLVFCDYEVMVL